MKEELTTLRDLPVQGMAENAKRKVQYNSANALVNEIAKRFEQLGKKFQNDEQIKVEYARKSLFTMKQIHH